MENGWTPNLLVLGVGGLVGEAWMTGILAGMEERTGIDLRDADAYVGTSAGSIVAATLAAGVSPRRPEPVEGLRTEAPSGRSRAATGRGVRRAALDATYPFASLALDAAAPAAALARAAVLASLPDGRQSVDELRRYVSGLGAEFDGRLRIVAVDRATGRRVVFGAPGAPPASVVDAVAASCAVPSIYAPVSIGGRRYVDGGVWSPTNLDVAETGAGDRVLCMLPTGAMSRSPSTVVRGLGAAVHGRTAVEIAGARRRGATVRVVTPDARAARAMGPDPLDPARRPIGLSEGFRQAMAA